MECCRSRYCSGVDATQLPCASSNDFVEFFERLLCHFSFTSYRKALDRNILSDCNSYSSHIKLVLKMFLRTNTLSAYGGFGLSY